MDNSELSRWREIPSHVALLTLADFAAIDRHFEPRVSTGSTRWHANVAGQDFEILCTGSKFFDTRVATGGGGAVDLAMHLLNVNFKEAVRILRRKGM